MDGLMTEHAFFMAIIQTYAWLFLFFLQLRYIGEMQFQIPIFKMHHKAIRLPIALINPLLYLIYLKKCPQSELQDVTNRFIVSCGPSYSF